MISDDGMGDPLRTGRQLNGSGSPIIETDLGTGRGEPATVVLTAEHLVADLRRDAAPLLLDVADHDDLTLGDHLAVLGAGVVGGPLAAPAQRLDLEDVHPVGELDEPRGPGEERGSGSR